MEFRQLLRLYQDVISLTSVLGIDLQKDCEVETTLGVGRSETVYQYKGLSIKIGNTEFKIPVGFLERDDIPPPFFGEIKLPGEF